MASLGIVCKQRYFLGDKYVVHSKKESFGQPRHGRAFSSNYCRLQALACRYYSTQYTLPYFTTITIHLIEHPPDFAIKVFR